MWDEANTATLEGTWKITGFSNWEGAFLVFRDINLYGQDKQANIFDGNADVLKNEGAPISYPIGGHKGQGNIWFHFYVGGKSQLFFTGAFTDAHTLTGSLKVMEDNSQLDVTMTRV